MPRFDYAPRFPYQLPKSRVGMDELQACWMIARFLITFGQITGATAWLRVAPLRVVRTNH